MSYRDLDREERETIDVGYIETPSYVIGGVLGTWIGLGLGHGIQGRFSQMGWVFTAGELGSIALAAGGVGQCIASNNCSNGVGAMLLGYMGFIGFRIWEIIDVWAAPPFHNKRYLRLKKSLGEDEPDASFYVAPLGNSVAMGLQFRF